MRIVPGPVSQDAVFRRAFNSLGLQCTLFSAFGLRIFYFHIKKVQKFPPKSNYFFWKIGQCGCKQNTILCWFQIWRNISISSHRKRVRARETKFVLVRIIVMRNLSFFDVLKKTELESTLNYGSFDTHIVLFCGRTKILFMEGVLFVPFWHEITEPALQSKKNN